MSLADAQNGLLDRTKGLFRATTPQMNGRGPLRIAIVHPDLGIGRAYERHPSLLGGAERLVVDAAKVLQQRGHEVIIYTSHHDKKHCFEETKSTCTSSILRVSL